MTSKRFITSLLASALLAGLGMSSAMAQQGGGTYTPGIDRTQQAISARIQQGLASGQITPYEAQLLYRRDRDIEMRESRFKANGNATPQERQQLRADLAALNAEVDRMMSNRDLARQPGHDASTPGIDNREFQISRRIEEGVRSGRITQNEARRLHRQQREIERREAYFKSDGVVTQQERRQLRSELEALQGEVERMMRNERHERNDHRYGRG
jgi:hypothetical protein